MAQNRRLLTDQDFNEVMEKQIRIRVFKDDHVVDSGVFIIRYNVEMIVVQSGVSDLNYYQREQCEFFEMKKQS